MPDQYGLPEGKEQIAAPKGLSPAGRAARDVVLKIAKKYLGKTIDTGGCTTFYTPKAWDKKGWGWGGTGELVVVYEGGDLHDIFSYMGEFPDAREQLNVELAKLGLWYEDGTNWALVVYELNKGSFKAPKVEPKAANTNSTVDRKERRLDLGCSFCPPNRKENANRQAKPDRYKNSRRGRK